ncbi:hypothetical protein V8C42DRAFT_356048 [Trichoderma barbatum]
MESNPIVALAGKFNAGKQSIVKKGFKDISITAYTAADLKKSNDKSLHWDILVAGDKFLDPEAEVISTAKERKVPILNASWVDECFKSKSAVNIELEHLWDKEYNPTNIGSKKNDSNKDDPAQNSSEKDDPKKDDPKENDTKTKEKEQSNQKDSDAEMHNNGEDESDEDESDEESPKIKTEQDDAPVSLATGINRVERDPVRRRWYDEVEGGPWTINVSVHSADVLDNKPDSEKRRNYTMWIECIYSYYFVVTDPQTPIFVDIPQLRDAYILPVSAYPALKSEYIRHGGHVMSKQDIAYNGRICLIFGTVPEKTDNSVWTRSDLKTVFPAAEADEHINAAFLALDHGDPDKDSKGRRINPV